MLIYQQFSYQMENISNYESPLWICSLVYSCFHRECKIRQVNLASSWPLQLNDSSIQFNNGQDLNTGGRFSARAENPAVDNLF